MAAFELQKLLELDSEYANAYFLLSIIERRKKKAIVENQKCWKE